MTKTNKSIIYAKSVTTTVTLFLNKSKSRKSLILFNNDAAGADTAFLLTRKNQVYTEGIPIPPQTALFSGDFDPQGEFWIAADANTVDLRVWEVLEVNE